MYLKRVCTACGGDGWTRESPDFCPVCKKRAKTFNPVATPEQTIETDKYTNLLSDLTKKPRYTKEGMANIYKHMLETAMYKQFVANVGSYLNSIVIEKPLPYGFLFACDKTYVLEGIANAANFMTLRSGKKAFPFVDSLTLHAMFTNQTPLGDFTFQDAIEADNLCILLVTELDVYKSFQILTYLIKTRAVRGKATVVMSTINYKTLFNPERMGKISSNEKFKKLVSYSPRTLYEIGYTDLF